MDFDEELTLSNYKEENNKLKQYIKYINGRIKAWHSSPGVGSTYYLTKIEDKLKTLEEEE